MTTLLIDALTISEGRFKKKMPCFSSENDVTQ